MSAINDTNLWIKLTKDFYITFHKIGPDRIRFCLWQISKKILCGSKTLTFLNMTSIICQSAEHSEGFGGGGEGV